MKKIISKLIKIILHIFWIFPIKKENIFFTSYDGNQFSCNPKYIFNAIKNDYNCIWYIKKGKILDENIKVINKKNLKYYYYILTSKILITNVNFSSYIPFRKQQVLINTWHGGGAYKYAIFGKNKMEIAKNYKKFTCFLSSCEIASRLIIKDTFGFKGEILNTGFPRNDVMFHECDMQIMKKVSNYFNVNFDRFLSSIKVIYAPTYRDYDETKYIYEKINFALVKETFEKKYGKKCMLFVRSHHYDNYERKNGEIFDASHYPDMQELLSCIDILISDYSSCIWDFSISNKPCFLYAYDYDKYNNERSFYTKIEEWGFPISKNNKELCNEILSFDNDIYIKGLKLMRNKWGSYEKGNATDQVVKYLNSVINDEK